MTTPCLRNFGERVANYCEGQSSANLTCFTHQAHDDRTDSFCIGQSAAYEAGSGKFKLDCAIKKLEGEDLEHHVSQFSAFPSYWYNTGPKAIFRQHFQLDHLADISTSSASELTGTLFLVQREDNNRNLWHTMVEIMLLTFSLNVLRTNLNNGTGKPFFTDADMKNSIVVFLDSLADGPYYDLWSIFSALPPVRLANLTTAGAANSLVVVHLAGGSNPFWQGDWTDIDYGKSALLKTYARRVLQFYKVPENPPLRKRKLRLNMIDRKTKRRLLEKEEYFGALQAKHLDIKMALVDYAALSFAEQIKVSHSTDILVGIYGAGLTHGMFLSPHSTIVEILPRTLDHEGFRNMAKFLGHNHFSRHGSVHPSSNDNRD
ncbi:hypothetical protein LTR62_003451 [Meristemomyces frigidus]|uniref:EGF domain-specific O-linked N-acetylglucosamine transferase n=1 Tax=Meristemomyces frigidus TaxID=1508187 RepID=A0AAN7TKY4_9PEZI|nr:hypothetical protein LTR62_003451 [Meristemomyces frigidus]